MHILDYLFKRNLRESAAVFKRECQVPEKPGKKACFLLEALLLFDITACAALTCSTLLNAAIEAPAGLLHEWWSIFWDIYIARTNPSYSKNLSLNEVCSTILVAVSLAAAWLLLRCRWLLLGSRCCIVGCCLAIVAVSLVAA